MTSRLSFSDVFAGSLDRLYFSGYLLCSDDGLFSPPLFWTCEHFCSCVVMHFCLIHFVANWIGYWNHSRDMKNQPAFVWIIGRSGNCKCWTVFYGFPPTLPHRILTVPNASEPNRPNSSVATQRAGKAVPGHCRDSLNLGCIIACNLYDPIIWLYNMLVPNIW